MTRILVVLLLAAACARCVPHQHYKPAECSSIDDCFRGQVCGDTRTCASPCDDDEDCNGGEPFDGLVCGPLQGYCVVMCLADEDCSELQTCGPDGACWFEP